MEILKILNFRHLNRFNQIILDVVESETNCLEFIFSLKETSQI